MSHPHSVALVCLISAVMFAWVILSTADPIIGRWLKLTVVGLIAVAVWQAHDLVLGLWQTLGLGVVLLVLVVVRQRQQTVRQMQALEEVDEQDIAMMHGLGQY